MPEKLQASLALIVSDVWPKQVLLTKRAEPEKPLKHGLWHLPGGRIEKGETPEEAIERELCEELGLFKFHILKRLTLERENTDFANQVTIFYIFLIKMSTDVNIDISNDPDASEARWFELAELQSIKSFEMVTKAVAVHNISK